MNARVILAEDVVRPNRGSISPILGIIRSTLTSCLDLNVASLLTRESPEVQAFLEQHQWEALPTEAWSRLYVGQPRELMEWVGGLVRSEDCVIGFEMPSWMKASVRQAGAQFCDVRVSPLRFGSDIYLHMSFSDPSLKNRLGPHVLKEAEVRMEAQLIRSYFSMREGIRQSKAKYSTEPASSSSPAYDAALVFVGQAPIDYSKIDEQGRVLAMGDYADQIRRIASGFDAGKMFYKRHPYYTLFPKEEKKALEEILGVPLNDCEANAYELAAAVHPIDFCGISSGLLQEVGYFGQRAHCLFRPFTEVDFSDPQACQVKFNSVLASDFWSAVLDVTDPVGVRMDFAPNRARQILNVWWDYPDFERSKIQ